MICDFCSSPVVRWTFHVLPIPIVVDTPVGVLNCSNDDWAACLPCKLLIDAGNREDLLERTLHTYPTEIRFEAEVRDSVRKFHGQFFDLLDGPGEPEPVK